MKRELVEKMVTEGTPLPAALKATDLSTSSYYYRPKETRKPKALDVELVATIKTFDRDMPRYTAIGRLPRHSRLRE